MTDAGQAALAYAQRGWLVLPVHGINDGRCTCGRVDCHSPGKHPRTSHGYKDATKKPEIIEQWWSDWPNANVGIATGCESGLLVIDLDPRNGGDVTLAKLEATHGTLPPTVEAQTGGGGRHLFFQHPGVKVAGKLGPGIDVKAAGGYVVAFPSIHASGNSYCWRDGCLPTDQQPAVLPAWILELLKGIKQTAIPGMPGTPVNGNHVEVLLAGAKQYVSRVPPVAQGSRNSTAFNLAGHLFAFETDFSGLHLTEQQVSALLRPWNRRNAPPLTDKELAQAVASAKTNGTPREPHVVRSEGRLKGRGGDDPPTPVLVNLAEVQPERIAWLWPQRFPLGKLSLLVGDPNVGKSLVTLDIAARVSRGKGWPDVSGGQSPPAGVVLLTAEDDLADTVRPRLDAAGADVSQVVALLAVRQGHLGERSFSLSTGLPALERAITDCRNCKLVIVDPITAYLGATDSHKNAAVRGLLAPLSRLATCHGVAVIGVTHLRKGDGSAMYRPMGSLAFVATARSVYAVCRDKLDASRRLIVPVKCNLAKDSLGLAFRVSTSVDSDAPHVCWLPDRVTTTADEALAPAGDERQQARQQAGKWLRKLLRDGQPMSVNKIRAEAQEAAFAWGTVRRAKDGANIEAVKLDFKGGWAWRLRPPFAGSVGDHNNNLRPFEDGAPLRNETPPEAQAYQEAQALEEAHPASSGPPVPAPERNRAHWKGSSQPDRSLLGRCGLFC